MAGKKQVRDKSLPPVELSFSLACDSGPPQTFTLKGTESVITVGRRLDSDFPLAVSSVSFDHCELFLRRKNRDPVLCLRDLSRNLTGVRNSREAAAGQPWRQLRNDDVEVLHHRSQLLVPLRQRASPKGDLRTAITVLFVLPDAFCPWDKTGRWHYEEKLGEGGLAVVYRATDMTQGLGQVAVKVSKFVKLPTASSQNRHIYALHREARWSLERLHHAGAAFHEPEGAELFARYLEDHTGLAEHSRGGDFDDVRRFFEDPKLNWAEHSFAPELAERPYLVMEFVDGTLLQQLLESGPPLDAEERRAVVRQCAEALVYMERFGVIHRDFRGCNIFVQGRGPALQLKVIDLGFMISSEAALARNPNPAVRCAWQGDPERKLRYDWAPPEVRPPGSPNFAVPGYSFDVFSFGVLVLKLLHGRTWAQDVLQQGVHALAAQLQSSRRQVEELGLAVDLLLRMVDHVRPEERPSPDEIYRAVVHSERRGSAQVPQDRGDGRGQR